MGGGGSKPTPEQIRQISANLDLLFSGNCSPNASVQQTISFKDVVIRASDNCSVGWFNLATVNSTCDMSAIIDAVAQLAVQADAEFAKALMSAQDAAEALTADVHTQQMNVKKKLTAECHSVSQARQSILVSDSILYCDKNAQMNHGNKTDVRATCLRNQLHNALTEASGVNEEPSRLDTRTNTQQSRDYAGIKWTDEKLVFSVFVLLLLVVIVWKI
jgi:hypothetical protein